MRKTLSKHLVLFVFMLGVRLTNAQVGDGFNSDNVKTETSLAILYLEDWEDTLTWKNWTIVDSNSDEVTWLWQGYEGSYGSSCAAYRFGSVRGDDWLFSPAITLRADRAYRVSFWNNNLDQKQSLKVTVGSSTNPVDHSAVIVDLPSIDERIKTNAVFTVPADGDYNIGFYCYSEVYGYSFLFLDDIKVEEVTLLGVPGETSELKQEPGTHGDISMKLTWTNPSVTYGGDALTEITAINIYKDGATTPIIYTANLNPGGLASWTDPNPVEGEHTYKITVENSLGESFGESVHTYIGVDLPKGPDQLTLVNDAGNAKITWELAEFGVNNGWFNHDNITYRIVRNPGNTVLETNYSGGNSYIDSCISSLGVYSYMVTSKNDNGTGGTSTSNELVFGSTAFLPFTETWEDLSTIELWTIIDGNNDGATWERSFNRGGEYPSCIYYNSHFGDFEEADDWLMTPAISFETNVTYRLTFSIKAHILQFISGKVTLGKDASVATQNTTLFAFEDLITGDEYIKETVLFTVPADLEFNIGFYVFEGANNVYIDDITIEKYAAKDLKAIAITGATAPVLNKPTTHTVTILNNGTEGFTSYKVQLLNPDGNVLATKDVTIRAFPAGATSDIAITWTPTVEGEFPIRGKVIVDTDEVSENDVTDPLKTVVQGEDMNVVTIGKETTVSDLIPLYIYGYTFSESVYMSTDFGLVAGSIESIAYKVRNGTGGLKDQHLRIWMGETKETSLNDVGWIPSTDLTLVFDKPIDIPGGTYDLKLPLEQAYNYSGGNLVILIKGIGEQSEIGEYGLTFLVSSYNTAASRYNNTFLTGDSENPDNSQGVFLEQIPNTMFYINTENTGALSGYVYEADGITPVVSADVSVSGLFASVVTDENGYYEFPYIASSEYTVTVSMHGYADSHKNITIKPKQTSSLNFNLDKLPMVSISGTVVERSNLEGISNAAFTLSGYDKVSGTTDSKGEFTIDNVYGNQSYTITISASGYSDYTTSLELNSSDLDLDTIVLDEFPNAPYGIKAKDRDSDAHIVWNKPVAPTVISKDNGVNYGSFGSNKGVFSVGHRYTPDDLKNLGIVDGLSINKISIYVGAIAQYKLKIWSGMLGTESEIYSEDIDPTIEQWYEHTLASAVPINVDQSLVIGYEITQNGGVHTAGFDTGPAVKNGNVFKDGAKWTTIDELVSTMDYNWNIKAYCAVGSNAHSVDIKSMEKDNAVRSGDTVQTSEKLEFSFVVNNAEKLNPETKNGEVTHLPEGYRVWRLLKGEEDDEGTWELLTSTVLADTFFVDTNWAELKDTTYRFAVKSEYKNGILSDATFSNVVDKGKYAEVTVKVTTNGGSPEGAVVTLSDLNNEYSGVADETGTAIIDNVYFATYKINISKKGYREFEATEIIVDEKDEDIGAFQIEEDTRPPKEFSAVDHISNVVVSWRSPGSSYPQWIFKDDGINDGGFGVLGGGTMVVAQEFTPAELEFLGINNYNITKIKIFPSDEAAYTLKVWSNDGGGNTEIYSETITPALNNWYEHKLPTPVPIDASKTYLIGYKAEAVDGHYPVGHDDGPHIKGGDLVLEGNMWSSVSELSGGLYDINWNIHAYCSDESMSKEYLPMIKKQAGVLQTTPVIDTDKNRFKSILNNQHFSSEAAPALLTSTATVENNYKLWRLIEGNEKSPTEWTLLTNSPIPDTVYVDNDWENLNDTNYVYAITAKYTNENYSDTIFTNVVEKGKTSLLTIRVKTNNELSAQGAKLTLTNKEGTPQYVYKDTVGADGSILFYQVYKGDYTVMIEKDGYTSFIDTTVSILNDYETKSYELAEIIEDPLSVTSVDYTSHVQVSWLAPGTYLPTPRWMYWDNDSVFAGIGIDGDFEFDAAQRFTPEDLVQFKTKGLSVTKVSFYIKNSDEYPTVADFTIKVWKGSESPDLVYSQKLTDPQLGAWNEVVLDLPVPINEREELWVGYNCNATAGYPAGIDVGPKVAGKGNMIYVDGEWMELTGLSNDLNYNWLIHVYCDETEADDGAESRLMNLPVAKYAPENPNVDENRISLSKEKLPLVATSGNKKSLMLKNSLKSTVAYNVWVLNVEDEGNEDNWTLLTETAISDTSYQDYNWTNLKGGEYKYAVKAVYVSGQSKAIFSNSLNKKASGLSDRILENDHIYPNPNKGQFIIYLDESALVTITDINGREIFCKQLNLSENNINLNVNDGIYLVNISSKNKSKNYKVIIKR